MPTSRSRRATRRRSSRTPRACSARCGDGERCLVAAARERLARPAGRRRAVAAAAANGSTASCATSASTSSRGARRPTRATTTSAPPATASSSRPTPRCAAQRPAYRDLLILRDVHGLDTPLLCAVTDMSEADVENLLYRARAEFAKAFAEPAGPRALPRPPHRLPGLRRARAAARHAAARAAAPRAAAGARARAPELREASSSALTPRGHRAQQARRRRPCRASR